jgi:uncharacterized membrane protein YjjP (DUF1212 family)
MSLRTRFSTARRKLERKQAAKEVVQKIANQQFHSRAEFLSVLSKQLHEAGTTAARLENALATVGRKLSIDVAVWSSPTAIMLSMTDTGSDAGEKDVRLLRLNPGDINLRMLADVDEVAENVIRGKLEVDSGLKALAQLQLPASKARVRLETIGGFLLANFGVAALLGLGWIEISIAAGMGLLLGVLHLALADRRRFSGGLDAMCAIVAAFVVAAADHWIAPINTKSTLLASLIVLVPGLSITSAAVELATQHLVSGTARMAGAFTTLLKLSFGAFVGSEVAAIAGLTGLKGVVAVAPSWIPWLGLLVSACSFAVMFKAKARDVPLAIFAAILGYTCTRWGGQWYGAEFGVFFAGLVVTLCANFYARFFRRPGALIRLPGIILLVPGSIGFKSLFSVVGGDVGSGLETAVALLLSVVSLSAGLLLASTLLAPRHSL